MRSALARRLGRLFGLVQMAGGGLALVAFFLPWVVATDGVLRLSFSGLSLGLGSSPFFVFNRYVWLAPITLVSPLAAGAVVLRGFGILSRRSPYDGRSAVLSLIGLLPVAWLVATTAEEVVTAHAFEEFRILGIGSVLSAAAFGGVLLLEPLGYLVARSRMAA